MPAEAFLLLTDDKPKEGNEISFDLTCICKDPVLSWNPLSVSLFFSNSLIAMFFSRKYRYTSTLSASAMRSKLLGQHMNLHNLDFEVQEKDDRTLRIVPHAEQVTEVKTLPITHVAFKPGNNEGGKTQVVISAHMRRIDQGGPTLIVVFSIFMLLAGAIGHFAGSKEYAMYTLPLFGLGALIFIIMWVRLETGYFDYVRKIRNHIKQQIIVG